MSKTIKDSDVEMLRYLQDIDPVIQASRIIQTTGCGAYLSAVSLLKKTAPLNALAMQAYNVIKSGNWRTYQSDIMPPLDEYFKQRSLPFWNHYYSNQNSNNYVPYYYKSEPCTDQNLLNDSIRMTGVSAGNSSIWIVDKAKVLPTIIGKRLYG